jgi:hypothetical protein
MNLDNIYVIDNVFYRIMIHSKIHAIELRLNQASYYYLLNTTILIRDDIAIASSGSDPT